jgi:hypothetical protein
MEITVYTAKFHGAEVVYEGKSEKQAIRIARKQCGSRWDSDCQCGGAEIFVYEDGKTFRLHDWQATPAFQPASEIKWEFLGEENEI